MSTQTDTAAVIELWGKWNRAYSELQYSDEDAAIEAEQRAYDELVDYVEAHDLNNTEWDPR